MIITEGLTKLDIPFSYLLRIKACTNNLIKICLIRSNFWYRISPSNTPLPHSWYTCCQIWYCSSVLKDYFECDLYVIFDALVKGMTKHKGYILQLNTHADSLVINDKQVIGICISNGYIYTWTTNISNTKIWKTTSILLILKKITAQFEKRNKRVGKPKTTLFTSIQGLVGCV